MSLCQVYTRIRGEQRAACKVRVLVATVVTMALVNWILAVNMAVSITVSITISVTVSVTSAQQGQHKRLHPKRKLSGIPEV